MLIPDSVWNLYRQTINNFIEQDAGLQPVIWLRKNKVPALYGEDRNNEYTPISINVLMQYNYIRGWPFNINTPSGTLDKGNSVMYITKKQLEDLGYLDNYGNWSFDNVEDRFIISGKVFKPMGDTSMSQAKDSSLLYFIVLEPEDEQASADLLRTVEPIISCFNQGEWLTNEEWLDNTNWSDETQ